MEEVNIETGYSNSDQLYDLKNDPSEKHNVAAQFPEKVKQLKALLKKVKEEEK